LLHANQPSGKPCTSSSRGLPLRLAVRTRCSLWSKPEEARSFSCDNRTKQIRLTQSDLGAVTMGWKGRMLTMDFECRTSNTAAGCGSLDAGGGFHPLMKEARQRIRQHNFVAVLSAESPKRTAGRPP
jgi:hypothetical protein